MNYYNEFDPFAAAWLQELINAGEIPNGHVDTRSICDIAAEDLRSYAQCHFFAGIGGWSLALKLAEWPDNRPVWTGSCPCQPFSSAGNQKGKSDERHLWPAWLGLIRERKPSVIFGEQVASAIAHGWLDDVYQGLEAEGYAVGAAVLPACSIGAPHRRDRLWFGAHAISNTWQSWRSSDTEKGQGRRDLDRSGFSADVADTPGAGLSQWQSEALGAPQRQPQPERQNSPRGEWWAIEPSVGRVANGVSSRVGKLRGYGNAIVPQAAAEFIKAAS